MTLTDTGPLVALVDANEARHEDCRQTLSALSVPLVTPWPCFTETMYLLGKSGGFRFQNVLWQMQAAGRVVIHQNDEAEVARMAALMAQFRDTPMDLADASLVAAAETLRLRRVFTLDRHFYAYRTADGKALEVVP